MTLSGDQWKTLEASLNWTGAQASLLVDGYCVTIERVRMSKMRDALMIYVNGHFRAEWLSKECEERHRFFCARERYVFPARLRRNFQRDFGKRRAIESGYHKKITQHLPWWSSFDAMRRHFIKNNSSITIAPPK